MNHLLLCTINRKQGQIPFVFVMLYLSVVVTFMSYFPDFIKNSNCRMMSVVALVACSLALSTAQVVSNGPPMAQVPSQNVLFQVIRSNCCLFSAKKKNVWPNKSAFCFSCHNCVNKIFRLELPVQTVSTRASICFRTWPVSSQRYSVISLSLIS